jgi:hypothetical protein
LVLITAIDAGAAPPAEGGPQGVTAAQQRLATARANLAQAAQRIEKDPPSNEDLDAAQAAVVALKEAIDAGAEQESNDLDYARAVLAARREMRTQREYIDQRRASIQLHALRQEIDRSVADLGERVRRLDAKEPSSKEFDDARVSLQAVKKALDEARQVGKQDQKFMSYLAEVDAAVARHDKTIDDRWLRLLVDKHRPQFAESRQALSAAISALGKSATDAQLEAAERAITQLTKRIEEGKALEFKDPAYRSDADRARTELAQGRKRIDELWSEMGLARLKSEIEPAYKELAAASNGVRARKPTEDQLAEARTAAIVVRKLVEKYQPQAARNPAFAQYLTEVKQTLGDVELELQRRGLDSARADLVQALRNIERRNATDEHFEEANSALMILEKTLPTVHARDPELTKRVDDARTLVREARTKIAERRIAVEVQQQRAKVEAARKTAAALVAQAHQAKSGKDAADEAETAINALRAALEEGAALAKKDREYGTYAREIKERIDELQARIAARKIALAANEARTLVSEALAGAKAKLDAAKQPEASDSDIAAASQSLHSVSKAIESRASVEQQDKGYAAQAAKAREQLDRLQEGVDFAKQARALRRRTVEALAVGAAAAEAGAAAGELNAQRERYEKALAQFRSCESSGESMVEENKALGNAPMLLEGQPTTAKEVIALCAKRSAEVDQSLKQVLALIRFEEGPKRSFETGKVLLAQAKKTEALSQFDECIASGLILQNRNPELKDRKFEVAGSSMTLTDVVQQCISYRKPLRGK